MDSLQSEKKSIVLEMSEGVSTQKKVAWLILCAAFGIGLFHFGFQNFAGKPEIVESLVETSSARTIRSSLRSEVETPGTSRSLDELLAIYHRFATSLPDAHDEEFDPAPIRQFVAELNLEETKLLFLRFQGIEGSQIFQWKLALAGRWGELDGPGACDHLGKLVANKLEADLLEDFLLFESPSDLHQAAYLGWGRVDFRSAWQDLVEKPDAAQSGSLGSIEEAVLKQFGEEEPDKVVSFLIAESSNHIAGLCRDEVSAIVLSSLPSDTNFLKVAESLKSMDRRSEFPPVIQKGPGGGLFDSWSANDPEAAVDWYLGNGTPIFLPEFGDRDSIANFFLSSEEGKLTDWLDDQLLGGSHQKIAQEITVGALRGHLSLSREWMNRFVLLPDPDDRFAVMSRAVAPIRVHEEILGPHGIDRKFYIRPDLPAEIVEEFLPRFRLAPDQEDEIRAKLESYETE